MGRWQPYLYDPQRESDEFNPKAVTMASYAPPSPTRSKPEGPLINFNKHPDSYVIMPYGKNNAKPMNRQTRVWIKTARGIQLFFRLVTLLGAIGTLLCTIFLKGVITSEGYIMRIPAGVDMVNCLYAVYHLLRAAKARPAGSSASYHFFALVMDGGFIPLYVFTTLYGKRNYDMEAGTSGRWRTIFPTDEETEKVLLTLWLTATATAGLHCASLILDLYLVIVFRKISHLPPDMNPLEENLTSRRKSKHKHKNSSISAITPLTGEEKRFSTQSDLTLIGTRKSQHDPLISEKDIPTPDATKMAFLHTRTDSNMTYSPHTPDSARNSRIMYNPPAQDPENETLAERRSFLAQQAAKTNSTMSSSKQSFYTPPSTADNNHGDIAQHNLQSANWFVHNADDAPEVPAHSSKPKGSMFHARSTNGYKVVSPYDDMSDEELDPPLMPQPLRMNPPTPPPNQANNNTTTISQPAPQASGAPPQLKRTNTVTGPSSEATFQRTLSRPTTPGKSRYYGDLKAATSAIKGKSSSNSLGKASTKSSGPNNLPSSTKQYTSNTAASPPLPNAPFSLDKKSYNSVRRTGELGNIPVQAQSPRVVSRSGVDYMGRYEFENDADLGTPGRRRDVSGKVAEEGRGGAWGPGMTYRKVSEIGA